MKQQADLYKWPDDSWRFAKPEPVIEMRSTTLPDGFTADPGNERVMAPLGAIYIVSMNASGELTIKEMNGVGKRALHVFFIERA